MTAGLTSFYDSACNKVYQADAYMNEHFGKMWEVAKKVAVAAALGFAFYEIPFCFALALGFVIGAKVTNVLMGSSPLDKYNFSSLYGGLAIALGLLAIDIASINPTLAAGRCLLSCLWVVLAIKEEHDYPVRLALCSIR